MRVEERRWFLKVRKSIRVPFPCLSKLKNTASLLFIPWNIEMKSLCFIM